MPNILRPKRSSTAGLVPTTSNLTSGEFGVNMADRRIYINNGTAVVQVGAGLLSALGDVTLSSLTSGQTISWNGTAWVNSSAGSGTVTSVALSGGTTGLTTTGGPITTTGTITLAGTLAVANGGTGATTAAAARTNLGATTLGANLFTLANVAAIAFPRINADNSISSLDAATFRAAIGAGTSSTTGTVTSVGGTGTVSGLSLSGTVTTSGNLTLGGTLAVTPSNFASQTANTVLAAPNGAAGVPTFRALVAADIPTLNQNTTGSAGSVAWTNVTGRPTAVSSFTNDSGYITAGDAARTIVKFASTVVGTRRGLNFLAGTGISLTLADDPGNEEVDITITSTATGGVTSFNTRTGAVTLSSSDVTTALGYTPLSTGGGTITTSGSSSSVTITDTGTNGANLRLIGNGATTPNKTIRAQSGLFQVINNAYTAPCFSVNDAGDLTANGNVTAYSDERLKTDWAPVAPDFIERLALIKSGTYTRTDNGERQAGASAQDWQRLLPEAVQAFPDDMRTLALAYGNAAVVSAIELAKRVIHLEARLKELELKAA